MGVYTGYITEAVKQVDKRTVIAVYETHKDAEWAVRTLREAGCNLKQVSVIGLDAANCMRTWGKSGAIWGGLWGLLFGSVVFYVTGVGLLLVSGPVVTTLLHSLEDEAVPARMSALTASLSQLGVSSTRALAYETEIKAGKFIVIVHGLVDQVSSARTTLAMTNQQGLREHRVRN